MLNTIPVGIMQDQRTHFACDMMAIAPSERAGHHAVIRDVFGVVKTIEETPDGYTFCLPDDAAVIRKAAKFISKERLCCPFFGFALTLEPEGGPLRLGLTGPEGVKPFIVAEIGGAVPDSITRPAGWQEGFFRDR